MLHEGDHQKAEAARGLRRIRQMLKMEDWLSRLSYATSRTSRPKPKNAYRSSPPALQPALPPVREVSTSDKSSARADTMVWDSGETSMCKTMFRR